MSATGASMDQTPGGPAPRSPRHWPHLRLVLLVGAALVVAGAVYLAVTRADALLLDLAALAQCF